MPNRVLTLELPEEIVTLLGSAESAAATAREALVLELLRQTLIGQSKAAELLKVSRADVLDLMVEHRIPSGPVTPEDVDAEVASAQPFLDSRRPNDGGQQ